MKDQKLTQSRLLTIGVDMTERKIKKAIYRMFKPIIRTPDIQHLLRGNEDDEQLLELEYKHIFEGEEEDDPIYKVQILNNLKVEAGYFTNSRPTCEFCGVEHSNNCDFSFENRSTTIKDIMRRVSN